MLHRLCGPPSIPLSFTLASVLPRWVTYRFRLGTHCISRTPSNHRLQRGLPGYLILFDPHAFVPQRQLLSSELPSLLVFLRISMHFTATCGIPPTSTVLKLTSINGTFTVKLQTFTTDLISAYVPFKPNKSGQRLHPPYYRGCWHGVSRCLFIRYRQAATHSSVLPV